MKPHRPFRPHFQIEALEQRVALSSTTHGVPVMESVHASSIASRSAEVNRPIHQNSHASAHETVAFHAAAHAHPAHANTVHLAHASVPQSQPMSDSAGATTAPITHFNGVSISTSDDLWYFGGITPAFYSTTVTLTAANNTGMNYTWTITQGANIVGFQGGGLATVTTMGNTVSLSSKGASAAQNDIHLQVSLAGVVVGTATMTVPTPRSLAHIKDVDLADGTYGYASQIHYKILDQFGTTLPKRVPINEQWTTGVVNDFAGTDWRRGAAGGATIDPTDWYDLIQGEAAGFTPAAQSPQSPLGNTAVEHWGQAWFVGSNQPGQGVRVQTNTLQKYRDHARHTGVVSPP